MSVNDVVRVVNVDYGCDHKVINMSEIITLSQDTYAVQYLCHKDKRLAKVISMVGDIQYTPYSEGKEYAFLIHEIIEQMLSIKAGKKIYDRLNTLCGGEITPSAVSKLTFEDIRSTGTSNAKAQYIQSITEAVLNQSLDFQLLRESSDSDVMKKLTSFRGIGSWTAKMYLIFVLNRDDILPYEDGAWLQTYRWMYKTEACSPKDIKKRCQKWSPYASIASRYLYRALDQGLTKNEFHLFKEE